MSDNIAFDIADPLQLREALLVTNRQIQALNGALEAIGACMSALLSAIGQMPPDKPIIKADLVAYFRAAASRFPDSADLQQWVAIVEGSAPTPGEHPSAPSLRLVVSNPPPAPPDS